MRISIPSEFKLDCQDNELQKHTKYSNITRGGEGGGDPNCQSIAGLPSVTYAASKILS